MAVSKIRKQHYFNLNTYLNYVNTQFVLSAEEQSFFEANDYYDYGELLANAMIPFQESFKASFA